MYKKKILIIKTNSKINNKNSTNIFEVIARLQVKFAINNSRSNDLDNESSKLISIDKNKNEELLESTIKEKIIEDVGKINTHFHTDTDGKKY